MELLLLVVVGAVVFIAKTMGKLSSTSVEEEAGRTRGVMGEVFPTVEVLEPTPAPQRTKKKKEIVQKRHLKPEAKPSVAAKEPAPVVKAATEESVEKGYAIKDKSEIKKAIVYAEIFGKKYF